MLYRKALKRALATLLVATLMVANLAGLGPPAAEAAGDPPGIIDIQDLFRDKGALGWSSLTENEKQAVLSEYDWTSGYLMERFEDEGVMVARSIGCAHLLDMTSLTFEEALIVDGAYGQATQAIPPLAELEQLAKVAALTDAQYRELRQGILEGDALGDLLGPMGIGQSLPGGGSSQTMSSVDPDPPQVDLSYVAPYAVESGENESVSLNTGSLSLRYPLVSLPGINGLDVSLGVRYDSSSANLYEMGSSPLYSTSYWYQYILRGYYYNSMDGIPYSPNHSEPFLDIEYDDGPYGSWGAAETAFNAYKDSGNYNGTIRLSFLDYWEPYVDTMTVQADGMSRIYIEEYQMPTPYQHLRSYYEPSASQYPAPPTIPYSQNGYTGTLYRDTSKDKVVYFNPAYWTYPGNNIAKKHIYQATAVYVGQASSTFSHGFHFFHKIEPATYPTGQYIYASQDLTGYYATAKSPTYGEVTGDIGAGWSWDLPSYDAGSRVLRLGDGSSLELNSNNYAFKDHALQDMAFSAASPSDFTSGALSSSHKLKHSDGTTDWFSSNGRCIGRSDRFGNKIHYQYTAGTQGSSSYRLSKVVDAAGRETDIAYQSNSVTVTAPDGKSTVLSQGSQGGRKILNGIARPGQPAMTFDYSYANAYFYLSGAGGANNTAANLIRVNHPTGGKTEYTYAAATEGIGAGSYSTVYKVSSRKDIIGAANYNANSYSYSGTYTGYPSYYKQSSLPSHYTYTATATNPDGVSAASTFNNKGLQTSSVAKQGAAQLQTKATEYDANKLPEKVTTRQYDAQGSYVETVEMTEYDVYGRVLYSWSPLAGGVKADEYKTSFAYDNTYGLPTSQTWKKDANTTILVENTLSLDKKTVLFSEIKENNVLKQKTGYTYTVKGQIETSSAYKDNFMDSVQTTYTYDMWGNVASASTSGVKDSGGADVASPAFPAGTVGTLYGYDIAGRLISETDANGNETAYAYDAAGNISAATYPGGAQLQYTRDYAANTLTVEDAVGTVTRYEYDPFGNEICVRDMQTLEPLGTKAYDLMFRLGAETGPAGTATVAYSYDPLGRLLGQTATANAATLAQESYAYVVAAGLLKTTKTVHGGLGAPSVVTTEYVDNMGNIVKQGAFLNSVEYLDAFAYDYAGNKTQALSAHDASQSRAFTSKWEYDYAGRVTKETNALGQYSTKTYDALGRNVSVADYAGNASTFWYDALGRLLGQETPFEQIGGTTYCAVKRYDYDPSGNVIRERTQNNAPGAQATWSKTEYAYDSRGFLTDAYSYDGANVAHHVEYAYDLGGNMLAQEVAGAATQYEYDRFGNLEKLTDPLGQFEEYTYDLAGNALSKADRNGALTEYVYDGLGRLLTTTVTRDNKITGFTSLAYTLTGQTKTLSNSGFTATSAYDELGRLVSEAETGGTVKNYAYDLAGNRTGFTLAVGNTAILDTAYSYDALNRLSTVSENNVLQATYTYDANGNRDSLAYPNGTAATYQYNLANLVTGLQNKLGNTVQSSFAYTYCLDGNQMSKTDHAGRLTEYAYDGLGRLTLEVEKNSSNVITFSAAYTYDTRSNRSSLIVNGDESYTVDYTYDLNDRLTSTIKTVEQTDKVTSYYYDPNGNTISQLTETFALVGSDPESFGFGGDGWELSEYNGFNQLVSTLKDGIEVSYQYKPDGFRLSKTTDGVIIQHIWDGSNIIAETTNGTVTAKHLRGSNLISAITSSGTSYYSFSANGDVVQLTDTSGNVTKDYHFDSFGVEVDPDPADNNPWRYKGAFGYYWDNETGNYYIRSRYMSPVIGRFLSADSHWNPRNSIYGDNPVKINERKDALGLTLYTYVPDIAAIRQSTNLYLYCGNNPVMFVDPTGEAWWHWVVGAVIVVGAAVAVVATAGGAAPALIAVGQVACGVAAGTTASTVAAGAFIGSAAAYGTSVVIAASNSKSISQFNAQGNWGTIARTAGGAVLGVAYGFQLSKSSKMITIAGKGNSSGGHVEAKNLKEQLAMKQVLSNPLRGATNLSNATRPIFMTDSRWLAKDGWVKMSQNVNGVEIHFVYNTRTGFFDDFKFK